MVVYSQNNSSRSCKSENIDENIKIKLSVSLLPLLLFSLLIHEWDNVARQLPNLEIKVFLRFPFRILPVFVHMIELMSLLILFCYKKPLLALRQSVLQIFQIFNTVKSRHCVS